MRLGVACAALALGAVGCFTPAYTPDLGCSETFDCPPGQSCEADGVCRPDDRFEPDDAVFLINGRHFAVVPEADGAMVVIHNGSNCFDLVRSNSSGTYELGNTCDELLGGGVEGVTVFPAETDYLIVVETYEQLTVTRVSANASVVSGPTMLTRPAGTYHDSSVSVSGNTLGVMSLVDSALFFQPFDFLGTPLANAVELHPDAHESAAITPTATGFMVAWRTYPQLHIVDVDTNGNAGPVTSVDLRLSRFNVKPTSDGFLFVGTLEVDGHWAIHTVAANAAKQFSAPTRVEAGGTTAEGWRYPSLAQSATGFGATWRYPRVEQTMDVYFAKLGQSGALIDGPVRLATDRRVDVFSARVIWNQTGGHYMAFWSDYSAIWYAAIAP